ncbi:MAG: hypothetical protein IJN11_07555 [Oscillospiraceae bacterium]|nr:hypothetical protein [Oscillospiraceae bacterium]
MKRIYICLVAAHTGLGQCVRRFSDYPYTHIAVSLDASLTDFVTYSRRRHSLPLDAGFMHEYRDYYAFGAHRSVRMKVFALPVSEAAYARILRFIHDCETDEAQMFNLFSMVTMPVVHGFRIEKTHNCMSFTARILALSGAVQMDKPYWRYDIREMDALLTPYFWREGKLRRKPSPGYHRYMEAVTLSETIRVSAGTLLTLTKRCLTAHSRNEEQHE